MSQLSTRPVLTCKRCGRRIVLSDLHTTQPDPDSSMLFDLFSAIAKDALCYRCRERLNQLSKEGREGDFYKF